MSWRWGKWIGCFQKGIEILTNEILFKDFITRRERGSSYIEHEWVTWYTHSLWDENIARQSSYNGRNIKIIYEDKSKGKKNENLDSSNSDILEDDEEESNFVIRIKKGTKKYRGKILLICFNFDGIGHFSNKCPHNKKKRNE
jgi:hypothetical protein